MFVSLRKKKNATLQSGLTENPLKLLHATAIIDLSRIYSLLFRTKHIRTLQGYKIMTFILRVVLVDESDGRVVKLQSIEHLISSLYCSFYNFCTQQMFASKTV